MPLVFFIYFSFIFFSGSFVRCLVSCLSYLPFYLNHPPLPLADLSSNIETQAVGRSNRWPDASLLPLTFCPFAVGVTPNPGCRQKGKKKKESREGGQETRKRRGRAGEKKGIKNPLRTIRLLSLYLFSFNHIP